MTTATYNAETRAGVLTFANGRTLVVENVTEEQFARFEQRNAAEFARRECILETTGLVEIDHE